MILSIIKSLIGLVRKLIGPIFFYKAGRTSKEKEILEDENKRLKNRPRTDNDVVVWLSKWRNKLKD